MSRTPEKQIRRSGIISVLCVIGAALVLWYMSKHATIWPWQK